MLGARALVPAAARLRERRRARAVRALVVAVTLASLAIPAVDPAWSAPTTSGLAGAGGLPGGREVGEWVDAHVPQRRPPDDDRPVDGEPHRVLQRTALDALSVSPNPLHRNPTYRPIINADAELAAGNYEYIVWDAYSAQRSPHFAQRAIDARKRFGGPHRPHPARRRRAARTTSRIIVIYQVHP